VLVPDPFATKRSSSSPSTSIKKPPFFFPSFFTAAAFAMSQLYERLGVNIPFDPRHKWVTSPAFSPIILAFIRLLLAFYTLFTNIFILVWEIVKSQDAKS
jgi:hypothetical protein